MSMRRREFLASIPPSALLSVLMTQFPALAAEQAQTSGTQEPHVDERALKFWREDVRLGGRSRSGGQTSTVDEKSIPEFRIYTEVHGFRGISQVEDKELLDSGDVLASVWVNAFKPSKEDEAKLNGLQSASLRIDVHQKHPFTALMGVLAWTAMAAIQPNKAGKLPELADLNFDNGGDLENTILPAGEGLWHWNVFLQHKESFFAKCIQFVLEETKKFAPVLSLPAITIRALQSFNSFYGYLQSRSRSEWLFQTAGIDVFATKAARSRVNPAVAVPLIPGAQYVLIRRTDLPKFEATNVGNLALRRGVIVPKETHEPEVFEAAKETLQDVTYLTVSVSVAKVPSEGRKAQTSDSLAQITPLRAANWIE